MGEPGRQRRRVAAAGVDRRRTRARANRSADGRALRAAQDAAEDGAADGAAADLGRAFIARRVALAVDGLGHDRHARAVGQRHRREAEAQSRAILQAAAALDQRHEPRCARAGRNHHAVADAHVARHAGDDLVLDLRGLARYGALELDADDRLRRQHQILVAGFLDRRHDVWLAIGERLRQRGNRGYLRRRAIGLRHGVGGCLRAVPMSRVAVSPRTGAAGGGRPPLRFRSLQLHEAGPWQAGPWPPAPRGDHEPLKGFHGFDGGLRALRRRAHVGRHEGPCRPGHDTDARHQPQRCLCDFHDS